MTTTAAEAAAIIAVLVLAVIGLGAALVVMSRRRSAYDRE